MDLIDRPGLTPLAEGDELVALIYDGPLEPEPWQSFLCALRLRTGADVAAITLRPGRGGSAPIIAWSRDPAFTRYPVQMAPERRARLDALNPLGQSLARPGDIYVLDEVVSRSQLAGNAYYREVMQPSGIEDMVGMYFGEPGGWECHVGLLNGAGRPGFGPAEKDFIRSLRTHLERALALFSAIRREQLEKEIYERALDRLSIGTFILDADGRVVEVNRSAQLRPYVALVRDTIHLPRPGQTAELQSLIREALAWSKARHGRIYVDAMRVDCPDGSDIGVLVQSIAVPDFFHGGGHPCAVVHVSGPTLRRPVSERFLTRLFGLTTAEAELACRLVEGLSLAQSAEALSITESTARTYMKRIFLKTGVGRQADVVRLIMGSVAVLA
jgi:DNA-binding CsgD family transcriptional regulator/PAS domain-containing protein